MAYLRYHCVKTGIQASQVIEESWGPGRLWSQWSCRTTGWCEIRGGTPNETGLDMNCLHITNWKMKKDIKKVIHERCLKKKLDLVVGF